MPPPTTVHLGPLSLLDLWTLADALALADGGAGDARAAATDPAERRRLQAQVARLRSLIARVESAIARLEGRS